MRGRSLLAVLAGLVASTYRGSTHSHPHTINGISNGTPDARPSGKKHRHTSGTKWPRPKQFKPKKHNRKNYGGPKHRY